MPLVDYSTEEDLKKKEGLDPSGQPTTQQSTSLAAGGNTQTSTGSGKGTGYVNLQTYLGNNAGQGAATTQQVLGGKQKQIDTAVDSLTKDADATKNAANAGAVQRNTSLEDQVKNSPSTIDKNVYNQYTQSAYKGPMQYTPSVEVEKQWQNLPTQTTLQQTADPTTIGKSLGKSNYTYGLGKLDSYLMNSEGAGVVDAYNAKNKDVGANRNTAVAGVNDAIKNAQQLSAANVQALRDTTNQSYSDTLKRAQGSMRPAQEAAYDKAYSDIQAKLDAAGVSAPGTTTGINTWIRPTEGYSWQDSIDPATLQALNSLADIDGNEATTMVNKGDKNPLSVDWAALDAYINAAKPAAVNTASGSDFKTTGEVYDQYGNRLDDGLTAAEVYDRLNKNANQKKG